MSALAPRRPGSAERARLAQRLADLEASGELLYYLPPPPGARHDAKRCADPAGCATCALLRSERALCGRVGCGNREPVAAPSPPSPPSSAAAASGAEAPAPGARLATCGGCREIAYCGPACAQLNWKAHKATCEAAAAKRAEAEAHASRPLSHAEQALVDFLKTLPFETPTANGASSWAFRRLGETEAENPQHVCFIISATESAIASALCCVSL